MEISPLIFSVNQWTGFYMIGTSVIKELKGTTKLLLNAFKVNPLESGCN